VYFRVFTKQYVKLIVFQVSLCSLKRKWYLTSTYERTFLRWFREVQNLLISELPVTFVCCICRCGKFYMGKIYTFITIRGFNIVNQEILLNIGICAAG
jgi:hypothetical protein